MKKSAPVSSETEIKDNDQKPLSRNEVERMVRDFRIEPILGVAAVDKKLIKNLQRLLYSGEDLLRMRAAETLGRVSAAIAEKDPGTITNLLKRLFYTVTDSAASSWGAFEAIGEIISRRPDLFGGYAPQLYQFLADDTLKAQSLQALGKIAGSRPDLLRKHTLYFFDFLEDPDPTVRGYTVWLMGNLGAYEARADFEKLLQESHEIEIYEDGNIEKKTVAQVASEALSKL